MNYSKEQLDRFRMSVIGLFEPWFAPRVYLIHEIGKMVQ